MQQKEALSAYMDGNEVNREFTDTLCRDAELQEKWASYHTIRSVMHGEEQLLGADFSAKMAALLENEEIAPLDESAETEKAQNQPQGRLIKLKKWGMPLAQAGIAASVCLVAVLGFNMMNNGNEESVTASADSPILQTQPLINGIQAVSYNAPVQIQPTEQQLEQQQRRVNALLQNHELQRRTNGVNPTLSDEEKAKAEAAAKQQEAETKQH